MCIDCQGGYAAGCWLFSTSNEKGRNNECILVDVIVLPLVFSRINPSLAPATAVLSSENMGYY